MHKTHIKNNTRNTPPKKMQGIGHSLFNSFSQNKGIYLLSIAGIKYLTLYAKSQLKIKKIKKNTCKK